MPFFDESPVVGCPDCGAESHGDVSNYCATHWRSNWHTWFAWYPVKTLDGGWVWFNTVHKKPIPTDHQTNTIINKFWYRTLD